MRLNWFKHPDKTSTLSGIHKVIHITLWVIIGICAAVAFAAAFAFIVQWLWNALMPDVFGLGEISYWQALGIIVLSKLLFGCGFGGGSKSNLDVCCVDSHDEKDKKSAEHTGGHPHHGHDCNPHHGMTGAQTDCMASVHHGVKATDEQLHQYWKEEGRGAFKDWVKNQEEKQGNSE